MSKKLVDGVWVIVCDWIDEKGIVCDLGVDAEPKMFVDPDGGRNTEMHFQCGSHHGILKQEDRPEYQLPEGHELLENTLVSDEAKDSLDKDVAVRLDGFKPDASK